MGKSDYVKVTATVIGRDKLRYYGETFVRERKTRITNHGGLPGAVPLLMCETCGYIGYANAMGEEWNYCPSCGARVVDDE